MLKLFAKMLACGLALLLFYYSGNDIESALAETVSTPKVTVLQNDFIKITVDNASGRFGIRTVDGQPIRKKDDNVNLLFQGDDPETSFTTFRIDGTDYIFGNPYKFGVDFFSEITMPQIVENADGTKQIETVWTIKGVQIKQILMLYADPSDKLNAGNVNVRYEVRNDSGHEVKLGTRILLDTMVGGNDGPAFQIGTAYRQPLTLERKLTPDPVHDQGIAAEDEAYYKLPPYWVMRDTLDPDVPLATNVMAYGFNNFAEQNINLVDSMVVGHWNRLANTKYDYTVNPNLDYTTDTNDYGTADSAVAFYWDPEALADKGTQSFETVYGLGEIVAPDKVFSIRYLDTPLQLATNDDDSAYADEGIFDINAEVENLPAFNMEQSQIDVTMALDDGLDFVELDSQGRIVRDEHGNAKPDLAPSKKLTFKKSATPEEAAQGIMPKYKPGDTVTATFKVMAKGKPYPTTEQYMLTASSPETAASLQGEEDEGVKAQYESNKSSFILLPAVGNAVATTAYGMTPKETYESDVKYITVNLTNIDAYNPGNDAAEPNFDLYLVNADNGDRYKVPVKSSVLIQPTDDGFSGDMRITYRGGDQVDDNGEVIGGKSGLGPELPLGTYKVQIDYKGDTGGNAEIASMYDLTTEQTFAVTDNNATRIRQSELMAVYKQTIDVSDVTVHQMSQDDLEGVNEAFFPGEGFDTVGELSQAMRDYAAAKKTLSLASKTVDPEFDQAGFLDDEGLAELPTYQYKTFASQDELDEFFDGDEHPDREMLVSIRGMIKESGTGDDTQIVVDTKTEPAIINDAVAYSGKDMVFVRGKLDIFGVSGAAGYDHLPFLDTLFVKGDGTLSVASSGFVFHKGEWTLDFFNGFDKTLEDDGEYPPSAGNPADLSLNGSLAWAAGALGDQLDPLRQVMVPLVYFNKHSLFSVPSFSVAGFGLTFNDFILRPGGISFGGSINLKILDAEVRNVVFNDKGFVGIDASLKFDLNAELGLIEPDDKDDEDEDKPSEPAAEGNAKPAHPGGALAGAAAAASGKEPEGPDKPSGEIDITHYVQHVDGVNNYYGLKFDAQLKNMMGISVEIAFKQVDDGRVLPDALGFGVTLKSPGYPLGPVFITGLRGAIRELADTIAGGTKEDPFPLTLEAGVSTRFGVAPAYFFGDIDLTLKRTGIKLEGSLGYSPKEDPEDEELLAMLTSALIQAQWTSPWFVQLAAEVNIGDWDIIVGKAGIFVGENLDKHRTDFEGYIGAAIQIPNSVPVVGGLPLASVFFGVNNDKIWGSIGILLITLGITYYWGGGVEFGTSGNQPPDGFADLLINDPEHGQRLLVIGQGMKTVATSWIQAEKETQPVTYRDVADGVQLLDNGSMDIGVGGIEVSNNGRNHVIPMSGVSGNAIVEVEYTDKELPNLALKDASGKPYPIVFDNTNTNPGANAFTQYIPAAESSDQVDHRKAYIILPKEKIADGDSWTLTSSASVETRLINVPVSPTLKQVGMAKSGPDANKFTANWTVDNAKPGDTVDLYLTQDALTSATSKLPDGRDVLEPGDPGMLIAKDVPVGSNGHVTGSATSGSFDIDITKVAMLGDTEDIRGLLQQGDYYLRAELKSESTFGTKTSPETIKIVDPLAPNAVSDVQIKPAGDGYFSLSFKPGADKTALKPYEHDYVISVQQLQSGGLEPYANFDDVLFTADELADHWNAQTGRYEGILLGGWTAITTGLEDKVNHDSLKGDAPDPNDVHYTGLMTGQKYVVGVEAAVKPDKTADKNENYHYAERVNSANTLLPVPAKPKLERTNEFSKPSAKIEMTTRTAGNQSIELYADQPNVEVEAFNDNQSIGKTTLQQAGSGSKGELQLGSFATDGTYAVELHATNTKTLDSSVKMLYLTVDTIAPILYLDEPITGDRTTNGNIRFSGRTTAGDTVEVLGATAKAVPLKVADDGTFSGEVAVWSGDPTVKLTVQASDKAGNANHAVIEVTNDGFRAPERLTIDRAGAKTGSDRQLDLAPGDKQKLQVTLCLPQGKDEDGKTSCKSVPAEQDRISYEVLQGDSVELTDDGTITATASGSNLIQASYAVSDDIVLQTMKAVSVEMPKATALGRLDASTAQIAYNGSKTKVTVNNPGDMLGYQLVYKVFANPAAAALPALNEDVSGWDFLPEDGAIPAANGDIVVVAKRGSADKKAVAASNKLDARVWSGFFGGFPGGFGGGGGGAAAPAEDDAPLSLNGQPFEGQRSDDGRWTARIGAADIGDDAPDIRIASGDASAKGFTFVIDKDVLRQAADKGRRIVIDVPGASLIVTPDMIAGMDEDLTVDIDPNDKAAVAALGQIADGADASLLASGAGVAIRTNIPAANWNGYAETRVPVPDNVKLADITAVVLRGPDGSWTTLPWKIERVGAKAYVNIHLTGNGNLAFMRKQASFADVKDSSWASGVISQAASRLFVMGRSADRFEPDSSITRAEYPTLLLRVAGMMNKKSTASFNDVDKNDWFYPSVATAAAMGIAGGMGDGSYAPNATISRIEAMVMAGRLLDAIGLGGDMTAEEADRLLSGFGDGQAVPEWAKLPAALCIREGIIAGENERLLPADSLTRAQAAAIVMRLDALITG